MALGGLEDAGEGWQLGTARLGAAWGRSARVSQLERGSCWEAKALQQRGQKPSLLQLFAAFGVKESQKPCDLSSGKSLDVGRLRWFLSQKLCLNRAALLPAWCPLVPGTLLPALPTAPGIEERFLTRLMPTSAWSGAFSQPYAGKMLNAVLGQEGQWGTVDRMPWVTLKSHLGANTDVLGLSDVSSCHFCENNGPISVLGRSRV